MQSEKNIIRFKVWNLDFAVSAIHAGSKSFKGRLQYCRSWLDRQRGVLLF